MLHPVFVEVRQFVFDMWHDANHYDAPGKMTLADAAYNLREYRACGGLEIPDGLTPGLYCMLWNRLTRNNGYYA